jgi:Na+-driven multidrug efflux pump
MTPTKINLVFFWHIQIPLSYFMSKISEIDVFGVFWAIFISETSAGLFTLWLFKKGNCKKVRV